MTQRYAMVCDWCGKTEVYDANERVSPGWVHLAVVGMGTSNLEDAGDFCSLAHSVLWLQERKTEGE